MYIERERESIYTSVYEHIFVHFFKCLCVCIHSGCYILCIYIYICIYISPCATYKTVRQLQLFLFGRYLLPQERYVLLDAIKKGKQSLTSWRRITPDWVESWRRQSAHPRQPAEGHFCWLIHSECKASMASDQLEVEEPKIKKAKREKFNG